MFKKYLLLSILIIAPAFGQTTEVQEIAPYSIYSIGTGLSFSYFDQNMGLAIDSLHLFRSPQRPFDNALFKIGIGINYKLNPIGVEQTTGFNFLASIGYIYIQHQYYPDSFLNRFGVGFSIDYSLIDIESHSIGATMYIVLNRFMLGIGGGAVFLPTGNITSYLSSSLAIIF